MTLLGHQIGGGKSRILGGAAGGSNPGLTNLLGWWKMDEASGDAIDSHTTGHDLPTGSPTPGSQVGLIGTERVFTQSGREYFEVPAGTSWFEVFTGPYWMGLTYTFTSKGGGAFQIIANCYGYPSADRYWNIVYNKSADKLYLVLYSQFAETGYLIQSSPVLNTRYRVQWYYDNDAEKFHIFSGLSEEIVDFPSFTFRPHTGNSPFAIGRVGVFSQYFDGTIDEMFIYASMYPTLDNVTWMDNGGNWRTYEDLL